MKRIMTAIAVAAMSLSVISCAYSDVQSTQVGCVYNGGPLDNSNFREYLEPGAGRESVGVSSSIYEYPTTVRQLRISLTPGEGDTLEPSSIRATIKGIPMQLEPTANFTINSALTDLNGTEMPLGCLLIEQHLRGQGATDFETQGGKWQQLFLIGRVKPILEDVTTKIAQNYDPTKFFFNTDGERDVAAAEIGKRFTDAVNTQLGGNFFCSPDYRWGSDDCGTIAITLPEPTGLSDADLKTIGGPQRAKTEANNAIAAANEKAREAAEVADARENQAESAVQLADAEEEIAREQGRVERAKASINYAWCEVLVSLGQDCDLVKAAEMGDYPDVVLLDSENVVVPVK